MERQYLNPPTLFSPEEHTWPYSHGVRVGNLLFIAGQVGLDKELNLAPDAEGQAKLAWESIRQVVEAAGGKITDVVSVTRRTPVAR